MGMYNEVFKKCPECGHLGYMQISQIVLGFDRFNLENPEDIAEKLSKDQIIELFESINDHYFICQDCENHFKLHENGKDEKVNLINSFLK